jgi:hypothetical protein
MGRPALRRLRLLLIILGAVGLAMIASGTVASRRAARAQGAAAPAAR